MSVAKQVQRWLGCNERRLWPTFPSIKYRVPRKNRSYCLDMYRSYFRLSTAIRFSSWAISSGGRTKSTHPLFIAVFGMKA